MEYYKKANLNFDKASCECFDSRGVENLRFTDVL